jgi:HEAT repeat protein
VTLFFVWPGCQEKDLPQSEKADSQSRQRAKKVAEEKLAEKKLADLMQRLDSEDYVVRQDAALELGRMGPRARPAVPLLIECLESEPWSLKGRAARALGRIGDPRAVDSLRRLLKDERDDLRASAAKALGDLGNVALPAVPDLIITASNESYDQYPASIGAASKALRKIGPPAIPLLMEALEDDYTLGAAGLALGGMGPEVIPYLETALSSGGNQAVGATVAAEKLGPAAAPLVESLIRALNENKIEGLRFAYTITRIGPGARDAVPSLIRFLLQSRYRADSDAAYQALASIGSAAVPALQQALETEEEGAARAKLEEALRRVQQ